MKKQEFINYCFDKIDNAFFDNIYLSNYLKNEIKKVAEIGEVKDDKLIIVVSGNTFAFSGLMQFKI